jgi:hypothetical protein
MDESERLICQAALAEPRRALEAWQAWRTAHDPATASDMLGWAGGYITRNLRSLGTIDPYLDGIARHHWLSNSRKLVHATPFLGGLASRFALTMLKSFGLGSDPDAWRVRPVADIDFAIPRTQAESVVQELLTAGFRPHLDADWIELAARIMNQRGSWNMVRGGVDLDVHWRVFDHLDDRTNDRLLRQWSLPASTAYGAVRMLRPEATLCLMAIHNALQSGRGASGLFDIFGVVSRVDAAAAARLACETDSAEAVGTALHAIRDLGAATHPGVTGVLTALETARSTRRLRRPTPRDRLAGDVARAARHFTRRPLILAACDGGRHRPRLERVAIRLAGPLSNQSIVCPGSGRFEINPVHERRLGPGWHHRFPHDTWRWATMPAARLALMLPPNARATITVGLAGEAWRNHAFCQLGLFANGTLLATAGRDDTELVGMVTPSAAHGAIELSLRCIRRLAAPQRGILAPRNALLAPVESIVIDVKTRSHGCQPVANPHRIRAASSTSSRSIHSSAVWAWAIEPGPNTTLGTPAAAKMLAFVP